jgi:quinol monooxygenase YgiN
MPFTFTATFTMKAGKEAGALRLVNAVKRQAEREQRGTLVYLVHRVVDQKGRSTRQLLFYERYRNAAALQAHHASSSWQAVATQWTAFFEGRSPHSITVSHLKRIAAFARPGAIPRSR